MSLRQSWRSYDYRAITIGALLVVLGTVTLARTPTSTLTCDRAEGSCVLRSADDARRASTQSIPLQSIRSARETCHCPGSKSCSCSVELSTDKGEVIVFAGLTDQDAARSLGNQVRSFLAHKSEPSLHLESSTRRGGGLTYGLFLAAAALIALGIRKNIVAIRAERASDSALSRTRPRALDAQGA